MKVSTMVLGSCATNAYLVRNEETGEGFIVDPADLPQRLEAEIERQGIRLKAILLTHGHFDHILAVDALRDKYGVPVYAGSGEESILADPALNLSDGFAKPVTVKADRFLRDGEELTIAGYTIRVLATPGHTSGSICFYIPAENLLFSGDTLFAGSFGRYDFPTGSFAVLRSSIRGVLFMLPDETMVLPGHDMPTTIGEEKHFNPMA